MTREELESFVLESHKHLAIYSTHHEQLSDEVIQLYLEAWHKLTLYYADSNDDDINILVIGSYLDWELIFATESAQTNDKKYQEGLNEARDALIGEIDEIVKFVRERKG